MSKKIISSVLFIVCLLSILTSTCHASASAKVFANSQSPSYYDCGVYAVDGLSTLGYYCTSELGQITKSSMLGWIGNTGNGYAMYVHTLGGSGYFNDYYGQSITSSNISGNWDFVFIDSSYSAATSALADAFHTTGYSNRCFLGWYSTVLASNADAFGFQFWMYCVGHSSIRTAAMNAAATVPGSGTTPIKLYGSTTYYGTAR